MTQGYPHPILKKKILLEYTNYNWCWGHCKDNSWKIEWLFIKKITCSCYKWHKWKKNKKPIKLMICFCSYPNIIYTINEIVMYIIEIRFTII
jgi:hypothetical protein